MKIYVLQVIFLIIFNISFGESFMVMVDKYFKAEEICLQQYTSRIGSIAQEMKTDSISCLKAADIRFQSNKKFEILKGPMTKCSSPESGIDDYFKCIENIAPETREKLREITTENELFLQNIDKIEQNKTTCLSKASSKGNYKSTNAVFYLNRCLQSIPQLQMNSSKKQILVEKLPPEEKNFFFNNLSVIKATYNQLKFCISYQNDYDYCFSINNLNEFPHDDDVYGDDKQQSKKSYLVDFLTIYSLEIAEIDKADDSCLREYIVKNLNANFKFDLKRCLMRGSRLSLESEENFDKDSKLIDDLIEAYNEFNKCRDITEDLDTYNCVHKKLKDGSFIREIKKAISNKSETNFKDFKETLLNSYTDQYPCMENLYDFLQFDGYNLRPMEKNVLYSCLEKGYKPTSSLPFEEQLAKDLSEIQEYLKTCTEHPKSPGYNHCFRNIIKVYDSTRQNLPHRTSKYSLEHDVLALQILLRTIL